MLLIHQPLKMFHLEVNFSLLTPVAMPFGFIDDSFAILR